MLIDGKLLDHTESDYIWLNRALWEDVSNVPSAGILPTIHTPFIDCLTQQDGVAIEGGTEAQLLQCPHHHGRRHPSIELHHCHTAILRVSCSHCPKPV